MSEMRNNETLKKIRKEVLDLCKKFPVYEFKTGEIISFVNLMEVAF